ncbi:MAG: Ig-like domain-containing protein [Myxococcales bacterium]|nr:Ig-like domain-containing protein [Myxococcales bacterium]
MKHHFAALGAMFLFACSGGTDTDKTTDDPDPTGDTGNTQVCQNTIQSAFPADGETEAYYRTNVRFVLLTSDAGATISVADADGNPVSGSSSVDETIVEWVADGDLTPSTSYVATLSYECGDESVTWSTNEIGGKVTVDVTDKVYDLDLASGEFVEPPTVGDLLGAVIKSKDIQILVSPTAVNTEVTFLGALGNGDGTQDICSESFSLAGASYDNPDFELTAKVLPLEIADVQVEIGDLLLSGTFAPDGTSIQGTTLFGTVDTRPLVPVLAEGGKDDAVCLLAKGFGAPCVACPSDGQPFCLSLGVENITALEISPSDPLEERTPEIIAKDKACAP